MRSIERSTRWAAAMIAIYVAGVAPSLGQTLLDSHAHRQTQNAYTALLYAEHGIDLLRPPLPVLGPPGFLPQEFPMAQALGSVLISAGFGPDLAMRVVGLLTFVASAVLLFCLARRQIGSTGAIVTLAAFLFNAQAWVYGRSSTIEYLAIAGSIAFLHFAIRWMDDGQKRHWAVAAAAGVVGILGKITTGGFYLLPVLLWRSRSGRWGFQRASIWALILGAVAVGGAWSAWAEAVRSETPAAAFLSLPNQYAWFFGTISQRLDLGEYRSPLVAVLTLTGFGVLVWGLLAVAWARASGQAPSMLAILGLAAAMPLLLFNLYVVHDYYWAAVAPLFALGIGMGAAWLRAHASHKWARRAMVGLAGAWMATIIGTIPTWTIIYGKPAEQDRALQIAEFVESHSQPDDWVVLRGWSWNTTFFYYARRQGLAVPDLDIVQDTSEIDFDRILQDPIFGPFIECDQSGACTEQAK